MIGSAELCSGLYLLKSDIPSIKQDSKAKCVLSKSLSSCPFTSIPTSSVNKDSEIVILHYHLGHPSFICQLAKHTRNTYSRLIYKPSSPFTLIHSDVWGPSRINNISRAHWLVSFIDGHTRLTLVFLMKEKSKVGHIFQSFNIMIHTQFKTKIQVLKTDNAKEYLKNSLGAYLISQGIVHIDSCVDTPQQNGVTKRKNKHLLEVARCLMSSSNVPKFYWGEAILTAAYLINRMPSRVLDFQCPSQVLHSFPHTRFVSSDLPPKIFGCTTFIHVYPQYRSKLDPRCLECIFLG